MQALVDTGRLEAAIAAATAALASDPLTAEAQTALLSAAPRLPGRRRGDGLMAIFGASLPLADHSAAAVRAALHIAGDGGLVQHRAGA